MKRRSFLSVSIALIVLFGVLFTKVEATNNSLYLAARHLEIEAKDVGYNFLHAYRTALKSGWRGVCEATEKELTPECHREISNVTHDYGLLMQCNN